MTDQPRTAAGLCPDCGHGMHLHSPLNLKGSYWLCAWWDRVANRQCSCRLAIEAQAGPAVASEGLRAALTALVDKWAGTYEQGVDLSFEMEQARAALADAGSVGALDVERLKRAIREVIPYPSTWPSGDVQKWADHYATAIAAAYDAERQGAGFYDDPNLPGNER